MDIILGALTAGLIFILYFVVQIKEAYKYWEKRNVPFTKPKIPFGTPGNSIFHLTDVAKQNKEHYENAKSNGYKHVGLFVFWKPIYMPIHPKIIKSILSTDFDHFTERGLFVNERDDPLSAHLFSLGENQWRKLRPKLTPTFTSGKMKMMFQILLECSDQLRNKMDKLISSHNVIEIKEILNGFTTNVIVSCAFGIDCNVFENKNSEFKDYGKKFIDSSRIQFLKSSFGVAFPNLARLVKLKLFDPNCSDFFYSAIRDTIEYRNKNNVRRNDFLQLLIDMQNNPNDKDVLTTKVIAAQAFIFFLGGYETSSTTMAFCLYELCMNKDIQEMARKEVLEVLERHGNILSYDAVTEMKYLHQIVSETLRKHPPFPVLTRICVKEYNIPDTSKQMEKGTTVIISTLGLHNDPTYFENPEKFDPERFSEENKSKIVPFTYLPFGEGPRNCIAYRFGLLQTKVGLITILRNYKMALNFKTEVPLKYDSDNFLLSSRGGIWLNVEKLES